ncbi:carbon-nitrogen hydrolase family protein [Botrimarina hoheduenensis]|uniref:(R)-stereoselective amidase n=1 Tax=Botrimarina hoheduenensis TaxID=2528000 RepID=A0A5C5VSE1_9BACT|nr:bifunctional GNAT family N-acetyltransferase/carbon-nitrogen hydrolase family protein [Botrimarina hoheduenensis]TWT41566.1 (R)-stereoselective amidase [Botrimarina hoheduenensis]
MTQPIDLSEFEQNIVLRQLTLEDFPAINEMQSLCFPGMEQWSLEQIESQLKHFPEGQLGIEIDGRLAASSSSVVLDYDPGLKWHDWHVVADKGFIRNHRPKGDTLYGLEIMVHPDFRGMKLSRRLYDARKELCREKNLMRFMVGGRIPGYHKHADRLTAREYIDKVVERAIYDPVLTAQMANGFAVKGITPNYLPSDTQSCGYATYLEWANLDYQPTSSRRSHNAVEMTRLCVVQYEMRAVESFDDFARQCEFFLDTASDYQSDFVLFPEFVTNQLLSIIPPGRPGEAARSVAGYTPQYLDFFNSAAIKYNVNVIGGSHFVVENDKLYNASFLFGRDGSICRQDKIHVTPNERRWWGVSPGNKQEVFETDCGEVAIQICYDIEFPELTRAAAAGGARIIFVPFDTDTRHGYLRVRHCAQARCIENHVYTAIAGCTGNLPFVDNADIHYAQSGIFTPADTEFARDAIAAECNPNVETVIIHDLDLEMLRRHRETGSVRNWHDRRTDLYRVVFKNETGGFEI